MISTRSDIWAVHCSRERERGRDGMEKRVPVDNMAEHNSISISSNERRYSKAGRSSETEIFFCLFKHCSSPLEIPKSFYNIRLLIEILPNHALRLAIKVIERFSSSTRVDKL